MFERIPAKGAILGFAVLAGSLSLTARMVDRGVSTAKRIQGEGGAAGGIDPDLQAALPPGFAAALAGQAGLVRDEESEQDGGEPEEEGSARPPDYVYPKFDPAGPGGHGVSMGAVPRNLGLRFVDQDGDSISPESVRGTQTGDDGQFDVRGYRSSATMPWWTVGSPALTRGSRARFTFEVIVDGQDWVGSLELDSVPSGIDVDIDAPVQLVRVR